MVVSLFVFAGLVGYIAAELVGWSLQTLGIPDSTIYYASPFIFLTAMFTSALIIGVLPTYLISKYIFSRYPEPISREETQSLLMISAPLPSESSNDKRFREAGIGFDNIPENKKHLICPFSGQLFTDPVHNEEKGLPAVEKNYIEKSIKNDGPYMGRTPYNNRKLALADLIPHEEYRKEALEYVNTTMRYARPFVTAGREGSLTFSLKRIVEGENFNVNVMVDLTIPSGERVRTALHEAAAHGHKDFCKYLLTLGVNIDKLTTQSKNTPLHEATKNDHGLTALLLLENGASLGARNADGKTPIQCAEEAKHPKLAETLQELKQNAAGKSLAKLVVNERKKWQQKLDPAQNPVHSPRARTSNIPYQKYK